MMNGDCRQLARLLGRVWFAAMLMLVTLNSALAMVPVSEAQQTETILQALPEATRVADKEALDGDEILIRRVFSDDTEIGYAFNVARFCVWVSVWHTRVVNVIVKCGI